MLLVLAGVVVAVGLVAAAELALRLLDVGEPRELFEFPAAEGPLVSREESWPKIAADASLSLDRIATSRTKPDGTIRVIVVGESTVAGFPFYPQLSFARLLEASLRDSFPALPIEVVNLGKAADPSDVVARVAIEALELDPDVLIVCSGHNEYQASYVEDLRDGVWPAVRRQLRKLRLVQLGFSHGVAADAPRPQLPDDRLVGDEAWLTPSEFERGAVRFKANLERIVDAAARKGVDVVLMTQVSNLRDFSPCYSHYTRKLTTDEEREYERRLREIDEGLAANVVPADTSRSITRLRELDPGVARAVFLAARWSERAGRRADATALYLFALEADGYPNRARGALNVAIARVAMERGAALADAFARFMESSRESAPGADLFLDYCHPTLEGMALLADAVRPALLERLVRRGAPLPSSYRDRPMLERATIDDWLVRLGLSREQLVGGAVRAGQGSLVVHLGLPENREALALARRAFEQALRIAPGLADAEQGLLVVELIEGARDSALARADRLAKSSPDALRKIEAVAQQFPRLVARLAELGLELRDGRLVPRQGPAGGSN